MRVYQFFDAELIKKAATHPRIWPSVSDDYCSIASYSPKNIGIYLAVEIEKEYAGFFWLHSENAVMWQIHTCLLPSAWGVAKDAATMAVSWMFKNTTCRKIITLVPDGNCLALRLAERCGFEVEGVIKQSIQKGGVLLNQTLLGLSGV